MLLVNITEFRKNLSYYLSLVQKEDIHITKNKEVVAILKSPDKNFYEALNRLAGCLKDIDTGEDYKDIIGEGIMKRYSL